MSKGMYMKAYRQIRFGWLGVLCLMAVAPFSNATSTDDWGEVSDIGSTGLVVAALAVPTFNGDWLGLQQASVSIVTASGIAILGKAAVNKTRPDGSDRKSFISNHTSTAFGAATTLSIRYGWQVAIPAYSVATLVGVGRVKADRHYWEDAALGALVGTVAGWTFTTPSRYQLQVIPWASRREAGVMVAMNW
ncbi:phosphatase PAP2 family protein [Vibrio sp. S4M6]|uniref:phosphatase PAP2 family protein n=2 Tax=Vibrio sinus TaxID=2946865 RepID=UPI00202AA05C|nr:phosphatase PAP2 family protein [Vibrio sinus]MCL9781728.1 phosphatase PAP2 family protein [Vibrio sinus]